MEFPKWEDGLSVGSFSEVEEKTIKAVCEQMKVETFLFCYVIFFFSYILIYPRRVFLLVHSVIKCLILNIRQSVQGHQLGEQATRSSIYETVRSEVRRAISDIQSDLESVRILGFLMS